MKKKLFYINFIQDMIICYTFCTLNWDKIVLKTKTNKNKHLLRELGTAEFVPDFLFDSGGWILSDLRFFTIWSLSLCSKPSLSSFGPAPLPLWGSLYVTVVLGCGAGVEGGLHLMLVLLWFWSHMWTPNTRKFGLSMHGGSWFTSKINWNNGKFYR